ncbi:alpha-L-rhamnosidase-related protein [Cephaloticoccus primus]|uniref:alpha-L-rhamnosidase-related protein n=1 Tax=Cephaloticoccus primus TaxID=1548207 RepID=UPI0012E962F2|nr:alpha-L-rhamnosidase C-terminal domain-containing protein [Cephaloticoccus primus]
MFFIFSYPNFNPLIPMVIVRLLDFFVPADLTRVFIGVMTFSSLTSTGGATALVELVEQEPVLTTQVDEATWLIDFGKVAFGNLGLKFPSALPYARWRVHFGEAATVEGRIHREPPGTVRYAQVEIEVSQSGDWQIVTPVADARNTAGQRGFTPPAVLTPEEWGVILPFRWVELERLGETLEEEAPLIEGSGVKPLFEAVRRAAFDASWDDSAAYFEASDELLNQIWELCHYSIKATTYAGVFVDGDRERIPYEADAYLNQLSYYACNPDPRMTRATFDHLVTHPTWPTEWAPHMIFIAYADWWHTGDHERLSQTWEILKSKLQFDRSGPDGLLTSTPEQIEQGDIVDWPIGERDGYVFTSVNTVVNAFHLRALALMAELAHALGYEEDMRVYRERFSQVHRIFLERCFDQDLGLFRDGVGTEHVSLHANLFPLAFGLALDSKGLQEERPSPSEERIAQWLAQRGMRCSPYAAQYLMEALFLYGDPDAALRLMTADSDRSWKYMVNSGTTITWEAWAQHYKPNQDWNHAWGAAPANLLPRFVLGVRATKPGWELIHVRPFWGKLLSYAKGRIPTPRGGISMHWERSPDSRTGFQINLSLPDGVAAQVDVPISSPDEVVWVDGVQVEVERVGAYWRVLQPVVGAVTVSTGVF